MSFRYSRHMWFLLLLLLLGLFSLPACSGSGATPDVELEEVPTVTAPAPPAARGVTPTPEPTATSPATATASAPTPSPTSTPTPEPTATPLPTATPPPPRVDKWVVTLVIEMAEKSERDGVEVTSFADTVTYDFSFIVLRGEIKGEGTGHRQPVFAPDLAGASVEEVQCPDLSVNVKATLDDASVRIQFVDRAFLSMCSATVSTPSTSEWVDYGSQLTAVLENMALELPLQDGGTVEGSGVADHATDLLLGETYELTEPMAYSYTATIGLFNPSLAEKRPTLAPTAEAKATLVPAADATAPSPLPESHTGVTLEKGDCFDLDSGEVVTDERCDVHFNEYTGQMGLAAQNGALLSSNMRENPPTRAECRAEVWLDVQVFFPPTGFYFCFQTNQGGHGFFVERDEQWEQGRIVFDWWVFP